MSDLSTIAASRQRKAVVPPADVTPEMSVFDYLRQCQPPLDKKIIDIACSQNQVPGDLKDDAAQEIRMMWSQLKPDTATYKPGQIAAYAHRMAGHAALRLRRELGSSVRLPGSAFRKRKDGSSYVTPGVLAQALDWNALEGWFQSDSDVEMPGMDAPPELDGLNHLFEDASAPGVAVEEDPEEADRADRVAILDGHKDDLSDRQYAIMKSIIMGSSYEEVMVEHSVKKGVLMREVAVASSIMGPMDL